MFGHRPFLASLLAFLFCAAPFGISYAKKPDPLVGHWRLNTSKTHYGGGAQKRTEETFSCAAIQDGVSCSINSKREDGTVVKGTFAANYDGTPARVMGIPDVDEITLSRASDTLASATFSYRGSFVSGYRATRSADGKTLTVVSVDPVTRKRLKSVVVYDLVEDK